MPKSWELVEPYNGPSIELNRAVDMVPEKVPAKRPVSFKAAAQAAKQMEDKQAAVKAWKDDGSMSFKRPEITDTKIEADAQFVAKDKLRFDVARPAIMKWKAAQRAARGEG